MPIYSRQFSIRQLCTLCVAAFLANVFVACDLDEWSGICQDAYSGKPHQVLIGSIARDSCLALDFELRSWRNLVHLLTLPGSLAVISSSELRVAGLLGDQRAEELCVVNACEPIVESVAVEYQSLVIEAQ